MQSPVLGNLRAELPVVSYNMQHKKRGNALIFNHKYFNNRLTDRIGTTVDCYKLRAILRLHGFKVTVFQDFAFGDIVKQIDIESKRNYKNHDCILICVLTHGDRNRLEASDHCYKPQIFWDRFSEQNCPSLKGKPKLFFIQACQGIKYDDGQMVRTKFDGVVSNNYGFTYQPDFLISASTVPGYFSWRNTRTGTWFINSLVNELSHNGRDMSLLTLLTFVAQDVASNCESYVPDAPEKHEKKQVPCCNSTLTKLVVFEDKKKHSLWSLCWP